MYFRVYKNYNLIDDLWKYAAAFGSLTVAGLVGYARYDKVSFYHFTIF
jgi:hypothetical protein